MKKGIDISYCQKTVDWSRVDAEFVIARAGYGRYTTQKDTMFESHYKGAKGREIPIGAYWYSYAMTPPRRTAGGRCVHRDPQRQAV